MPDISMCQNKDCPSHVTCYRFMATPDQGWQAYSGFEVTKDQTKCSSYMPDFGEKKWKN